MRWIFIGLVLLLPTSAFAGLITYQLTGHAQKLSDDMAKSVITVDFTVDTETWRWIELSAFFLDNTWLPLPDSNNDSISIWSTEPEGVPTLWFNWSPVLTDGEATLSFGELPEWKLHLNSQEMAEDPLSYLDHSFFVGEIITLGDGTDFGMSGHLTKVSQVAEPSSVSMFFLGLLMVITWRVLIVRCRPALSAQL